MFKLELEDYIASLKSEEEMDSSLHFPASFHIAKVQGRAFWLGSLHFKVSMKHIEEGIHCRLNNHDIYDCIVYWSRNKEHLIQPSGLANEHPGSCMIECPDVATAEAAKAVLDGMRFKGRRAVAGQIGRKSNKNKVQTSAAEKPVKDAKDTKDVMSLESWWAKP